jgi:hypothetical protein
MTWRDKLEIGLKGDAPYRKDNLPARQVRGPERSAGPGRSPVVTEAKSDRTTPKKQPAKAKTAKTTKTRRASR